MTDKQPLTYHLSETEFEVLFKEFYVSLCKISIQYVRREEVAEDIVHEQFMRLWECRDSIEIHTSIKSYLFRSVKNRSIDYLRSSYYRNQSNDEPVDTTDSYSLNPSDMLEESELSRAIDKALKSLPEKCYAIFSLKRFENLSYNEIADKLNISVKTVENQMTIAIRKLKSLLGSYVTITMIIVLIINIIRNK